MIDLSGKKIAILGFGVEGQAVLAYLKKHGYPEPAVLDQKDDPNYLDRLSEFDVLFRSPGVPRNHPKLLAFPDQRMIYSMTKLFFDLCPCPVVAVTGTKGKTTTASLIFEIVKASERKAFLGGNIGRPLLEFLDNLDARSVAVVELSSFQAQDLHRSPHVGVILNVTHDHLDDGSFRPASHVSQDEYLRAKAQMIANQGPDDFAVLHRDLGEIFTGSGRGQKVIFRPEDAITYETSLLGRHNLENIAAAVKAASTLGIPDPVIRRAVAGFRGVPQRLELVGEKRGVRFVNDSASTNPDSTVAAIRAFDSGVVLILGGSDKGLDYAELGSVIKAAPQVKALVVIGQVAGQIMDAVAGYSGQVLTGARNMGEIMAQAMSVAKPGDTVLLSPAAASFGMFKNSKDRGAQFNAAVESI